MRVCLRQVLGLTTAVSTTSYAVQGLARSGSLRGSGGHRPEKSERGLGSVSGAVRPSGLHSTIASPWSISRRGNACETSLTSEEMLVLAIITTALMLRMTGTASSTASNGIAVTHGLQASPTNLGSVSMASRGHRVLALDGCCGGGR